MQKNKETNKTHYFMGEDLNPFTPKGDQLQFSLSVSHQRYIIQYGECGNRQFAQMKVLQICWQTLTPKKSVPTPALGWGICFHFLPHALWNFLCFFVSGRVHQQCVIASHIAYLCRLKYSMISTINCVCGICQDHLPHVCVCCQIFEEKELLLCIKNRPI